MERQVAELDGGQGGRGRRRGAAVVARNPTFAALASVFRSVMDDVERADAQPTRANEDLFRVASEQLAELNARWLEIRTRDVPAFNEKLRQAKLQELTIRAEAEPEENPPAFGMLNEDSG
jgi:hypothetical protein